MDRFNKLINNNFNGFTTSDARSIIRDSAEVSRYVDSKREHFRYVQQLMNDRIIDEAMGRVYSNGEFDYDGDGGFSYRRDASRKQNVARQILNEEYPTQRVYSQQQPNTNDVMARLDAMEREMNYLREENRQLRSRYSNLR